MPLYRDSHPRTSKAICSQRVKELMGWGGGGTRYGSLQATQKLELRLSISSADGLILVVI